MFIIPIMGWQFTILPYVFLIYLLLWSWVTVLSMILFSQKGCAFVCTEWMFEGPRPLNSLGSGPASCCL